MPLENGAPLSLRQIWLQTPPKIADSSMIKLISRFLSVGKAKGDSSWDVRSGPLHLHLVFICRVLADPPAVGFLSDTRMMRALFTI